MLNIALKRKGELGEGNYVLHPSPSHNYWANISSGRLTEFIARRGDDFNIVMVGSKDIEGDFYALPFPLVKMALTDEFRSGDKTGRVRWVATIRNHQFRVRRCPLPIDVGAYFGNDTVLLHPGEVEPGSASDLNDYAIENRKIEIEQRQKQSLFRQRVLRNFEGKCCLSGMHEEALLIASHVVPWSERIDSRLDPANGLLLTPLYDRLFDKHFITFDDDLLVIVAPLAAGCSAALRAVLTQLSGKQARRPVRWPIKPEFLAHHRARLRGMLRTQDHVVAEQTAARGGQRRSGPEERLRSQKARS